MSDSSFPTSLPPFPPNYRASGVLLHMTSLPSPYGIGDSGPAALAWMIRFLQTRSADQARRVLLASLVYLPVLLAVLLVDGVFRSWAGVP
jgi:heme O synthase-like polyprenyltransferase